MNNEEKKLDSTTAIVLVAIAWWTVFVIVSDIVSYFYGVSWALVVSSIICIIFFGFSIFNIVMSYSAGTIKTIDFLVMFVIGFIMAFNVMACLFSAPWLLIGPIVIFSWCILILAFHLGKDFLIWAKTRRKANGK